jgi:hypothetical protein
VRYLTGIRGANEKRPKAKGQRAILRRFKMIPSSWFSIGESSSGHLPNLLELHHIDLPIPTDYTYPTRYLVPVPGTGLPVYSGTVGTYSVRRTMS